MSSVKSTSSAPSRFLVVIGVRPQYIKAAALQQIISEHNTRSNNEIELQFVDTAQHYSQELRPEYLTFKTVQLQHRLQHASQDPFVIFVNSLPLLGEYVQQYRDPLNGIIVMGDANPTLVGALVAAKLSRPLIHLEAGAKRDPGEQEEKNRRVADCLASMRFCVSAKAVGVLESEGLSDGNILTGDLWYQYLESVAAELRRDGTGLTRQDYVLVTIHRPHNLEEKTLSSIVNALDRSGRSVRWVVHPRSTAMVKSLCHGRNRFSFDDPLSYREMVRAMLESAYVLTDSGGLIRESHHLKRRVLVRRDRGGWDELIEGGYNFRIGRTLEEVESGLVWAENCFADADSYPNTSPLRIEGGTGLALEALLSIKL
jgi:UDP-N-acetylglucosamine 2-epimerase